MKKIILVAAAGFALSEGTFARYLANAQKDSMNVFQLKNVEIVSTRADKKTPVAFTNVSKAQLERVNTGVDIPFMLSMTPSVITTSDAGMGVGYSTLRIRGVDATRINITTNGIPMNDAEEQAFYWVDTPDLGSSLNSIQVQRGAGTSTNGAGAFGGTVNMQTDAQAMKPYAQFDGGYGTYNTEKETFRVGTGLIKNHFAFDARLSNITSDGYLDRASSSLQSYFLQGGYYNNDTFLKFIVFGGKEKTYHAWNYDYTYEGDHPRRYNSCGDEHLTDDKGNPLNVFYPNQTDNYWQTNYQLLFHHRFSPEWNLNAALHTTYGYGYYEEYKTGSSGNSYLGESLADYGLADKALPNSDGVSPLVRRKWMSNHFTGGVFSLDYNKAALGMTLGGSFNVYSGYHYGRVIWAKNIQNLEPDYEYYRNKSYKSDANIYYKLNYEFAKGFSGFADLQYRHIHYTITGPNDTFANGKQQQLDVRKDFNFFNPKVGLNWQINASHRLYASFSVAQREPTRSSYTSNTDLQGKPLPDMDPKSEKFLDYELGYQYAGKVFQGGINFYYMDYTDQLVQSGQLNDIGESVYLNVPDSYRCGIELMAAVKPCKYFDWNINATFSRNKIKNFTQVDPVYDSNWERIEGGDKSQFFKSTTIAFSPSIILNNAFNFHVHGFEAALQSHYVSRQYLTNTQEKALSIKPYFYSDLNLSYTFKPSFIKSLTIGCTIYNLFNEQYESNGWGSREYDPGDNGPVYTTYYGLSPQAGIHVMGNISIKF